MSKYRRRKGAEALRKVYGDVSEDQIDAVLDYKNIDLLRRFLGQTGKLKSRKATGLSAKHQRQLSQAVKQARFMALLPYEADSSFGRRS